MSLPTKKIVEGVSMKYLIWFLYGMPGIGKSTLASGFGDSPLFLYTSPVRYIDAYKQQINRWKDFVTAVKELNTLQGKRYSSVIVDTIDFLWVHCRKDVLQKRGIEHEGDMDYGKGFDLVRTEFSQQIAKLVTSGYPVVFISHARSKEERGRVVKTLRIVPTLPDGCKNTVLPICDIEGYMGFSADDADKRTGTRKIFFEPSEVIEAKDWTGKLPAEIETSRDPRETVKKIEAYLAGKVPVKSKVQKAGRRDVRRAGK